MEAAGGGIYQVRELGIGEGLLKLFFARILCGEIVLFFGRWMIIVACRGEMKDSRKTADVSQDGRWWVQIMATSRQTESQFSLLLHFQERKTIVKFVLRYH